MKKLLAMVLCACMTIGVMAGCGKAGKTSGEDPVHLRLVMFGEAGSRNTEFFEKEFNDRIRDELNMTIEVDYFAWGENSKIEAMLASGEEFAFMVAGSQYSYREKGYMAEIPEELIVEKAPNLMKARMGLDFSGCKYYGKNYIIPVGAQAFAGHMDNFIIRNDILNQVGLDYKDIKTWEDLTAACVAVKEAFPNMEIGRPTKLPCNPEKGEPVVSKSGDPSYIYIDHNDPDSDKVWPMYGSEEYKKTLEKFYEWKDMGFFDNENWLTDEWYHTASWNAGNALLRYGETSRIVDHSLAGVEGADVQYLEIENNQSVMAYNYDWGWGLSAEAEEYKEDLIRLLDWIYASKENYLFSLYGVEGVDWEYEEDGKTIKKLTGDLFFYVWEFQTMYYQNPEDYDSEDWERYLNFNSKAIPSKAVGFSLDTTSIETELAAINAVCSEYENWLYYNNYEEWAEAVLPKLEEAGYQKYCDEVQRQYSEWFAATH